MKCVSKKSQISQIGYPLSV